MFYESTEKNCASISRVLPSITRLHVKLLDRVFEIVTYLVPFPRLAAILIEKRNFLLTYIRALPLEFRFQGHSQGPVVATDQGGQATPIPAKKKI